MGTQSFYVYDPEHFQLSETTDGWATRRRTATYRAHTREHLTRLATGAGLVDAHWLTPTRADHFQPVLLARRPG